MTHEERAEKAEAELEKVRAMVLRLGDPTTVVAAAIELAQWAVEQLKEKPR
jgi:hypothetical protein